MTDDAMPKEDRKRRVLQFLDSHGLALPPRAIYTNLRREGITFSEKSVRRYLDEMESQGLVETMDEPPTYYEITDAGREYLET